MNDQERKRMIEAFGKAGKLAKTKKKNLFNKGTNSCCYNKGYEYKKT